MRRTFVVLALVCAGCGADFTPGSYLERTRVIGGVIEVEGEPDRAMPRRGETATLTLEVAAAAGREPVGTWVLFACAAEPSPTGEPECMGEPFAASTTSTPAPSPSLTVTVPEDLPEETQVFVAGVFCEEGEPELGAFEDAGDLDDDTVCTEGRGQILTQQWRLDRDAGNRRPRFGEAPLMLEGEPWRETGGCEDPEAPRLGAREDAFVIEIAPFDDAMRETYVRWTQDIPPEQVEKREALFVSHLTTHGELERQFTVFEVDGEPPRALEWSAVDLEGELLVLESETTVRLHFGVRDRRGGADFLTRRFCLTP